MQLLEEFKLEPRGVDADNALEIIRQPIDYFKVNDILERKKKESIEFLGKHI